jgi:transcriptional regulator with XRE-family HTH domain
MNYHVNAEALGRAVLRRREELGLSQDDLVARSRDGGVRGLSKSTINDFEAGRIKESVRKATLRRYDEVLNWDAGSCKAILDGKIEEPETEEPQEVWDKLSTLIPQTFFESVQTLARNLRDLPPDPEVREALNYLQDVASEVILTDYERLKARPPGPQSGEAPDRTDLVQGASLVQGD